MQAFIVLVIGSYYFTLGYRHPYSHLLENFIHQNALCLHFLTLFTILIQFCDTGKTITYCEGSLSYASRSSTSSKFLLWDFSSFILFIEFI